MLELTVKTESISYKNIKVKLPYYAKSNNNKLFYKVLSKEEVIQVELYNFSTSISFNNSIGLAFSKDVEICNEYEFKEAYDKALIFINNKLNE